MADPFQLRLTDQHWIQGSIDRDGEPDDLTTHGNILLSVDVEDISGCQYPHSELGINQSAVALLQTVFNDHIPAVADNTIRKPLFFHGCWIAGTCPNRVIDFRVRHVLEDVVMLDQFYVTGYPELKEPKKYYDRKVQLLNTEYVRQVLEFAQEAFAFLPQHRHGDDWEIRMYENWRDELEVLIGMAKQYAKEGQMSGQVRIRAAQFNLAG